MDRLEVHERIIATEYFLHGGVLDVPKIYDADGHNHSDRAMKGTARQSLIAMGTTVRTEDLIGSDRDDGWREALFSHG